jgi:high-affinity Fe2+/Pb2+ permease
MIPLSALFISVCIYDLKTNDKNDLDSLSIGTSSVIILFYLIYYLFEKLNQNEEFFIYSKIDFWIVAGLVMYSSGTFFTLVSSQNKFTEDQYRTTYNFIMSSFALFRNALFLVGFILLPKKKS